MSSRSDFGSLNHLECLLTEAKANHMLPLAVTLIKLSNDRHRFVIERFDGNREARELVSREFLLHDFLHFAVEIEAGLKNSFHGFLARNASHAVLSAPDLPPSGEALAAERVVGILTETIKNDVAPSATIAAAKRLFDAHNDSVPHWLTEDFINRIRERIRRLVGEWKAVPFGGSLMLLFQAD
jgi:hypothetical protein